jgi:transposase
MRPLRRPAHPFLPSHRGYRKRTNSRRAERPGCCLSRPEDLTDDQRQQAQQIAQLHPEITYMAAEAQAFAVILRQHSVETFDGWLQRTRLSTIRELRIFARGIQRDYAAVKAALELPYSNGMVEGNVNRPKFVKRSMFGRAKFDLLRSRVLARPHPPVTKCAHEPSSSGIGRCLAAFSPPQIRAGKFPSTRLPG